MTIKETRNFMERIKSHYQEFVIDNFKISEWYQELKKYDAEDVNAKFDDHLRSEAYGESIPKLYFLTKYLMPTEQKGKVIHYRIICSGCGKDFIDTEFHEHTKRCPLSNSIVRDLKRHFNLDVSYEKLMRLDDKNFEEVYQKYLNKMLDANIPDFRKKIILRCLYPDIKIDIDKIFKDMAGN